jgi:membrane protease YdiL (CAAX protease family)
MKQKAYTNWNWPLFMAFIRLPLILLGYGVIGLALRMAGYLVEFDILSVFGTLSVTFTNILCLGLLLWRARVEGFRLRDLAGFRRNSFLRDLAGGALWWIVLGALLFGGMFAAYFVIQSISGVSFDFGNSDSPLEALPQWLVVTYAIIAAVVFPLLNPPVEELQYRGYAQPRLIAASGHTWLGICIPALGFGLQHMTFAFTLSLTPAFVAGFFLWGLGAGVIAYKQKRLAQLIIAHFLSNLPFGIVPLVFMLSGV